MYCLFLHTTVVVWVENEMREKATGLSIQINEITFVLCFSHKTVQKMLHKVTEGNKKGEIPALSLK